MKLILSDKTIAMPMECPDHIRYIDLSALQIANCVGCFGCWTKTPGKCVIRDDAPKVYPLIAKSDEVLYISRIRYGSYDTPMKTMLERAIPVQQAYIRLHHGEAHHVQRDVAPKKATIVAYGARDEEEQAVFRQLIDRNAHNMNFESHQVLFVAEEELEEMVNREVAVWASC